MRTMPRMLLAVGLMLFASIAMAQVPTGDGTLDRPDGAKIHYQVSGHGQPMLLIHGYPLSGELFEKNRDALDDHYTVITLDQRGYGQSKAPDANATIQTQGCPGAAGQAAGGQGDHRRHVDGRPDRPGDVPRGAAALCRPDADRHHRETGQSA
ncbi:alpha/beta fold hydrolase [Frateuria sp. GZRR35]|uniref:alpha/beta fold hydrolase n=1 Tax=Frateuria sp. GZRR35 TaxID=3351536 RepID=UPI003EDC289E